MKTTALKDLDIWASNGKLQTFLNLDIQGAELSALRGMGRNISTCLAIYTEVNLRELYKGVPLLEEMDAFLSEKGFVRVDWEIFSQLGWGDALYINQQALPGFRTGRRLLRKTRRLANRVLHLRRLLKTALAKARGAKRAAKGSVSSPSYPE